MPAKISPPHSASLSLPCLDTEVRGHEEYANKLFIAVVSMV